MLCRVAAILMVCAGEPELAGPVFQSSDGCVLKARHPKTLHHLAGAYSRPSSCLCLLTSLTALVSMTVHHCCECCLTVCRAATILMVCAGKLERP